MNLITICTRFPTQHDCLIHLESVRWGDTPRCPHCDSDKVARKADGQRIGRWNCHSCHSSFNVLSKTIMQKTKIPLQKWFLAIGLMVNAKKSVSSYQLSRDLEVNQPSAWYMQQRIRQAMAENQADWLSGIVEADETYVGGRPRKGNQRKGRAEESHRARDTQNARYRSRRTQGPGGCQGRNGLVRAGAFGASSRARWMWRMRT